MNTAVAVLLFVVLGRGLLGRKVDLAEETAETERVPAEVGASSSADRSGRAVAPQPGAQAHGDAEDDAVTEERDRASGRQERQEPDDERKGSRPYQLLTIAGILVTAVLTLFFELEIGFVALTVGLVLALVAPRMQKGAVAQVAWPQILLITGVGTYVAVLQEMGTIDYVGENVASLAAPLMAALLLCYIGAVVSAFASSVAVLGSLIPLAVPLLQSGTGIGAVGFTAAMAVSSTIVDVSPFSTNGALVLANAPKSVDRDRFYRQLLAYGGIVTLVAPFVLWLIFVVLG